MNELGQLKKLLNFSDEGLVIADSNLKVLFVNHAFEKMSQLRLSELKNKKLKAALLSSRESPGVLKAFRHALRSGDSYSSTEACLAGNGLPVKLDFKPISGKGGKKCFLLRLQDLSEIKEVDRVKSEFVSLAAHQLRSPLSTIQWFCELLLTPKTGTINPKQKRFLNLLKSASYRMVMLVNSLLSASRLELGTLYIEPKRVDLVKLLKEEIEQLKFGIREKKLRIRTKISKTRIVMNVDPRLITMIFSNLINNSIKYTPDGGSIFIELDVRPMGSGFFGRRLNSRSLVFRVKDTGCGIPKKQHAMVFTKLFRADNARKIDADGSGLGLYILRLIVNNCAGEIWFESTVNKGTSFYFTLPMTGMKSSVLKR